jgi:anti-sigma regulatory factor (Ser/Thr protein kinase)
MLRAGRRCHPLVLNAGEHTPSDSFSDEPYAHEPFGLPCDPFEELSFSPGGPAAVREKVGACAGAGSLDGVRLRELQVAVTECAVNSIKYGGGGGTLRTWVEDATLICEFHDDGCLDDPLADRGLWLVHQLCDLVQIRTGTTGGTTIRLHTYSTTACRSMSPARGHRRARNGIKDSPSISGKGLRIDGSEVIFFRLPDVCP